MKNYICINGNKIELTEEQMKQLGIESKSPFEECNKGEKYHYIDSFGTVECATEQGMRYDDWRYAVANYCTDKSMTEQRALHETLSRLLWRFSMEHGGDEIDWNNQNKKKFYIYRNHIRNEIGTDWATTFKIENTTYFITRQVAEQAIKEIMEPFIEAHPEFVR